MTDVVKKEVSSPENWLECKTEVKTEPVDECTETYDNMNVMKTEVKEVSESSCVEIKEESSDSEMSYIEVLSSGDEKTSKDEKKCAAKRFVKTGLIACKFCDYTTNSKKNMVIHNYGHNEEKPCKCPKCGFETIGTGNLNTHTLLMHGDMDKIFTCKLCQYYTYRRGLLRAHMHNHSLESPLKCTACDYSTTKKRKMTKHLVAQHTEDGRRLKCGDCCFRTACPNRLKNHQRVHSKPKLRCTLKRCACPKPCKCPPCNFTAVRKRGFKIHLLTNHNGERKYSCDRCDYESNTKKALVTHIRDQASRK